MLTIETKTNALHTVFLASDDQAFVQAATTAFAADETVRLAAIAASLDKIETRLAPEHFAAIIVDIDAEDPAALDALRHLRVRCGDQTPVIVIIQKFGERAARALLHMRITDLLVKPVTTSELVRTCKRAYTTQEESVPADAQIYTFLPAAGGVGVSTLAIQTAFMLHNRSLKRSTRGGRKPETCIVDLDFQHGAIADYLDLDPRLDLTEIEPRPERLDRQLLEVMLSRHESGVSVIAAPNRPAEMRSFDPEMVTRLLDLVSAYFDIVVIDMPRTWFSWTDSVLLGSNRLFIVSEATVPGLRHTQRLTHAIHERLEDDAHPEVIVNRFDQRAFDGGLRRSDIEDTLGDTFVGTISNNYRLVREAIDRGVPLDEISADSNVAADLARIVMPEARPQATPHRTASRLMSLGRGLFARRSPA